MLNKMGGAECLTHNLDLHKLNQS